MRPFLGAALAVLIYAVLRGGLLASGSGPEDVNAFGFAAIAGLTGLSSEAASNKLQALFKELFGTVASESANEDQSLSGSTGETAEGSGEDENPVRT